MSNHKISKKVQVKPSFTYSHPDDSLELESEIIQTITNNSVINNYITNLVNQTITEAKVPLEAVSLSFNGATPSTATVLEPNLLYIGAGGALNQGVVLPDNPTELTEIYVINDSGGNRVVWGNSLNGSVIYTQGWNATSSSKVLPSAVGVIHKFTYVKFLTNIRWLHEEIIMA